MFILGFLFAEIMLPILDGLVELVQVKIEKAKGAYALDIAKLNKQVQEVGESLEKTNTQVIGFHMPSDEEEFEDEDF